MKIKWTAFLSGLITGIVAIILALFLWFMVFPIGSVGGSVITNYNILPYLKAYSGNAVKNYAKDKLFYDAIKGLNITVSDEEVEKGFQSYVEKYGGEKELSNILLDTTQDMEMVRNSIKKSILYQKALQYFMPNKEPTLDELTAFYEANKEKYDGDIVTCKAQIQSDLKAQLALVEYNKFMEQIETNNSIKVR